jgi:UDP-N-acetylglucosamine--N-acetylmuramyl-(pentapeptide) pyrophosphoryl-undecaprenol N-acetylglucosamine transferase
MPKGLRLLLAAGGTGGHLFPGIAVAEAAQRETGAEVLFVGAEGGLEREVVPRLGFPLRLIPAQQLRGRNWTGMARAWWAAFRALGVAWRVVRDFAPDVIFSIGGYASGPTVVVGRIRRVPCVLLEPNAIPGLTNRLLGRVATKICVGFPRTATFFPKRKAVCTGSPVRWTNEMTRPQTQARPAAFTLLILGGSAGARRLNQIVPLALAQLRTSGKDFHVLHQTGRAEHAEVTALYAQLGVQAEVVAFIENMRDAYAVADLVVCRAGAMTIAELTVLGKPSILAPYPYAADDHQRANAEVLVQGGAARMVLDADLTPERVSEEIRSMLFDQSRLETMARAAAALGKPDATRAVVRECLACVSSLKTLETEAASS